MVPWGVSHSHCRASLSGTRGSAPDPDGQRGKDTRQSDRQISSADTKQSTRRSSPAPVGLLLFYFVEFESSKPRGATRQRRARLTTDCLHFAFPSWKRLHHHTSHHIASRIPPRLPAPPLKRISNLEAPIPNRPSPISARQRPSAFVVAFSTTNAPRRNITIIDHEHRHCNGPFTGSPRPTVVRRGPLGPCASVPFPLPFQLAVVASVRRCTAAAAACSTIWKWQPPRRADCAQIFAAKRVSTPLPPLPFSPTPPSHSPFGKTCRRSSPETAIVPPRLGPD